MPAGQSVADLLQYADLRTHNRAATRLSEGARRIVRLDEREGYGVAWIDGVELLDGTIELEVRGQDVPQRSFLGIAFHGADDERYDAVFLRPFNFRHENPDNRARAVQYVSHPVHTWRKLREEHPGEYESGVSQPPDPTGWVQLRLEIARQWVRVFVGETEEPVLEVRQLAERRGGRVGLWVGNPSGGDFTALRVCPAAGGE